MDRSLTQAQAYSSCPHKQRGTVHWSNQKWKDREFSNPFFAGMLQQALLHLFLAVDAVLGPRHSFKPLLLHFFLTVRADAVFIGLDALERRIDHIQDRPVGVGHPEQELLGVGVRRFVRKVYRRIVVGLASLFFGLRNRFHHFFTPRQQFLLVVLEPFLVHESPTPMSQFRGHLKTT